MTNRTRADLRKLQRIAAVGERGKEAGIYWLASPLLEAGRIAKRIERREYPKKKRARPSTEKPEK